MIGPAILFVPAGNPRAMAKAPTLDADAIIYDLEDAVAPETRPAARQALRTSLAGPRPAVAAVRVNHPTSPDFTEDFLAARAVRPDALVVPKVVSAADLATVERALEQTDAPSDLAIWAMVETPRAVLDLAAIAGAGGRLAALVAGTNDLAVATGAGRAHMRPWLMQIVLAARANGLLALDGVHNDIADGAGFVAEAGEGAAMGFDGKTLIHPSQIASCRDAFRPSADEAAHARAVVAAFAREPEAGVLTVDGRMVERLHLTAARRILSRRGETA